MVMYSLGFNTCFVNGLWILILLSAYFCFMIYCINEQLIYTIQVRSFARFTFNSSCLHKTWILCECKNKHSTCGCLKFGVLLFLGHCSLWLIQDVLYNYLVKAVKYLLYYTACCVLWCTVVQITSCMHW